MSEGMEVPLPVMRVIETCRTFHSDETITHALNFKPGPKDIIITTSIKSGTTVTQQIVHGLRSRGDMSFEEIAAVSPFIDGAYDYGCKDLHAPQPYQPHMFKTHFWYPLIPKGGKYIVVVRKPADTAVSMYHFFEDWFFKKGEISIEDFMNFIWINLDTPTTPGELCSTARHIVSWYPHRFDENVLWLHYEDINQNRRECVRLIAEFIDIGADDEALQELVTKQSSFEFMKKHLSKFDEHIVKRAKNEVLGFDKDAGLRGDHGKVRVGKTNGGKDILSSSVLEMIDRQWNEVVTSATGYKSYEDLRNGINKEFKRSFE